MSKACSGVCKRSIDKPLLARRSLAAFQPLASCPSLHHLTHQLLTPVTTAKPTSKIAMSLTPQKHQHTEDVSVTPLNGQALESASQLLNVPELLAAVLQHMHPDDSLVPAACVSKIWGELATAANWQRCWIDVRKLMMVLHTCSYYMTVRIVHGEIEAGTVSEKEIVRYFAAQTELMMGSSTLVSFSHSLSDTKRVSSMLWTRRRKGSFATAPKLSTFTFPWGWMRTQSSSLEERLQKPCHFSHV